MKENDEGGLVKIIGLGGSLVLLGSIVGSIIGVYAMINPSVFSRIVDISQFEVEGFFLSVNLPSFVVVVALGYIFATTLSLNSENAWRTPYLSILSLIALVLSALSIFNFISLIGSFLALISTILAHNRPTFKALSRREASFFVEIGSMLIASFSILFLLMWMVSQLFQTYLMRVWEFGALYPSSLLILATISFLMFFVTYLLGLYGTHTGACGALNLIMIIAISAIAIRSQYIYVNLSGYLGIFMLVAGIISTLFGTLIYINLFFSRIAPLEVPKQVFPYHGRYCAYCGTPISGLHENLCSRCGRKLTWKLGAPFCPYCGRVVQKDAHVCPHCQRALG
jgi:MFS family permease